MVNTRHDNLERTDGSVHLSTIAMDQQILAPQDRGYSWLILISAIVYQTTVPSILTLYGIMLLKAAKEDDHDVGVPTKIWDTPMAIVPVTAVMAKLLLESWCRYVVKLFEMPRAIALGGLCLTVAGVLLSSFSTDAATGTEYSMNIFAGTFAGIGWSFASQQTEIIITQYFKEKLVLAQRLVRLAPYLGNCIMPLFVGFLCTILPGDGVVKAYGALLMQNCFFLTSYSRPIYIEKVAMSTYDMVEGGENDEDVIYSSHTSNRQENTNQTNPSTIDDDTTDIVMFDSKQGAKEINIFDIANSNSRFSTDFGSIAEESLSSFCRFSSDFGSLAISNGVNRCQEMQTIDKDSRNFKPLYRDTTENRTSGIFPAQLSEGTARRTVVVKRNFITLSSMMFDVNFYLYTLMHFATTFSTFILCVAFPSIVWEQNPSLNIWAVSKSLSLAQGMAIFFIVLLLMLPKSINEKKRLCAAFCTLGAVAFYGITLSSNRSLLVVWYMFASVSTAASTVLQQQIFTNSLTEFDSTATRSAANFIAVTAMLGWSLAANYEFKTCFFVASLMHTVGAFVFFNVAFLRRG